MDDLVHRKSLNAGGTNTKRFAMPLTWWASKNRLVLGLLHFHLCFLQAQGFFLAALLKLRPISLPRFFMLVSDHLSLPDFVESFFPQVACASSLNLSNFWVICVVHATCWYTFQSPFFCVLGTSGHAGYLGWCVVSGQCDL